MRKIRCREMALTFILTLACAFIFNGKALNAQVKLQETNVEFTELREDYDAGYIMKTDDSVDIKRDEASSSNPKVAEVFSYEDHISIDPIGLGECTITVPGADGTTTEVHVKVTEEYMQKWLKRSVSDIICIYGTKKISFWTDPGVYGTIKIGKESIGFSAKGNESREEVVKKLKKNYKLKDKMTITAKIDSNIESGGKTITITRKTGLCSVTYVDKASGSGKKLKLSIWDLHNGDKVYVTYKGKKYTKKIKKNKSLKMSQLTFKLKKNLKKSSSFKVTVKTKYKETLYSGKIQLINGKYEWVDPDTEDTGSEDTESE